MSRGMASGRAGTPRLGPPRLDEDEKAAAARAKQAEKDAKRAALEEKRAERAARKAERQKDKDEKKDPSEDTVEPDEAVGPDGIEADGEGDDDPGERPAAITVVHYAPGEEPPTADRAVPRAPER